MFPEVLQILPFKSLWFRPQPLFRLLAGVFESNSISKRCLTDQANDTLT